MYVLTGVRKTLTSHDTHIFDIYFQSKDLVSVDFIFMLGAETVVSWSGRCPRWASTVINKRWACGEATGRQCLLKHRGQTQGLIFHTELVLLQRHLVSHVAFFLVVVVVVVAAWIRRKLESKHCIPACHFTVSVQHAFVNLNLRGRASCQALCQWCICDFLFVNHRKSIVVLCTKRVQFLIVRLSPLKQEHVNYSGLLARAHEGHRSSEPPDHARGRHHSRIPTQERRKPVKSHEMWVFL